MQKEYIFDPEINEDTFDPETSIRTIVTYHVNDEGKRVKCTQRFKQTKNTRMVPKGVYERRKLAKFGQAANGKSVTTIDHVNVIRLTLSGKKKEPEPDLEVDDVKIELKTLEQRVAHSQTMKGDQYFTVKVSNLTEDATERDLDNLFGRFGYVFVLKLARDWETGKSRGFGFVSFIKKDAAERATQALNGHGFGHFVMCVEMLTSAADYRANKQKS